MVASKKTDHEIKPSYVISFVVAIIILIGGFLILRPKSLEGSYTTKVNLLGLEAKETYKFDGNDKVSRYQSVGNGKDSGTYKKGDN